MDRKLHLSASHLIDEILSRTKLDWLAPHLPTRSTFARELCANLVPHPSIYSNFSWAVTNYSIGNCLQIINPILANCSHFSPIAAFAQEASTCFTQPGIQFSTRSLFAPSQSLCPRSYSTFSIRAGGHTSHWFLSEWAQLDSKEAMQLHSFWRPASA